MEFSNSDSDDFEESDEGVWENRETLSKGRQAMGLAWNYVPSWTSRDAFREFFQNWMDGMIESEGIRREEISITIKDSSNEYLTLAYLCDHDGETSKPAKLLGFIRYLSKQGTLELTNFNAQLRRQHLDIGESSKRHSKNAAGTHGEGFKVAALVMVRKGYQVRYESANYYWNFNFGGRDKHQLYCHLSPKKDSIIEREMKAFKVQLSQGVPRAAKSNIWEDTTVKIGKVHGKDVDRITESKFRDWIKVALALDRPSQSIRTALGELILDESYRGRLYLKGLFLDSSTYTQDYKFSYNLFQGNINRDRQKLSSKKEEAKMLADIWGEAIQNNKEGTLQEYTAMLREDDAQKWSDIELAKDYMSQQTCASVWRYLLDADGGKSFFYEHKNGTKDIDLIRKSLKLQPFQLSSTIWVPLRNFGLVRTPQEQRYQLLRKAETVSVKQTSYSEGVLRTLRAILALDHRTKDLNLVFKKGGTGALDLFLEKPDLMINEKWIDFEKSHQNSPCRLSRLRKAGAKFHMEHFRCEHVVTSLYDLVLMELSKDQDVDGREKLHLNIRESLRQVPKNILIVASTTSAGQLDVSWTDSEGRSDLDDFGLDQKCQVTLHRESTCSLRRLDLLTQNYIESSEPSEIPDANQRLLSQLSLCNWPKPNPRKRARNSNLEAESNNGFDEYPDSSAISDASYKVFPEEPLENGHALKEQPSSTSLILNEKTQQLESALDELASKDQKLKRALESLTLSTQELRSANAKIESQQQQYSNTIEDLQHEVHQLKASTTEAETERERLLQQIETLRVQKTEAREDHPTVSSQSSDAEVQSLRDSVERFRHKNENLLAEVSLARADRESILSTLEGVLNMIQGLSAIEAAAIMQTTLQGVSRMIQGVLRLGNRATPAPAECSMAVAKRERIKDENVEHGGPATRSTKRVKTGVIVELE